MIGATPVQIDREEGRRREWKTLAIFLVVKNQINCFEQSCKELWIRLEVP